MFDSNYRLELGLWGPPVELQVSVIREWINLWQKGAQIHPCVVRAWPHMRRRLFKVGNEGMACSAWANCRVQAPLMDVDWIQTASTRWHRPVGDEMELWEIPSIMDGGFVATGCFQPLLDDFKADIRRDFCAQASRHPHCEGLQEVVNLWPIVMEHKRFERQGMPELQGLSVTVVAGG